MPWIYENITHQKVDATSPTRIADNFYFNKPVVAEETIVLPIYFSGVADNNQSISFNYDCDILDMEGANGNVMVSFDNNTKKAVIVSDGYFNTDSPVAYVTLPATTNSINATKVKFYGEKVEDVSFDLNKYALNTAQNSVIAPNPATNYTELTTDIPENGHYKLTVTDATGMIVNTLLNEYLTAGTITHN